MIETHHQSDFILPYIGITLCTTCSQWELPQPSRYTGVGECIGNQAIPRNKTPPMTKRLGDAFSKSAGNLWRVQLENTALQQSNLPHLASTFRTYENDNVYCSIERNMGKFQSRLQKITQKNGFRLIPQSPVPQWCVIRVVQLRASVIDHIPTLIAWVLTPLQGRAKTGLQSSYDIRRFGQGSHGFSQ